MYPCATINGRVIESGNAHTASLFKVCVSSGKATFRSTPRRPFDIAADTPELWSNWGFGCQVAAAIWYFHQQESSREQERFER